MKKLNKKGVTLIELIVSFALVATAVIYFYQTLSTVYDLYVTSRKETQEFVDKDYTLRMLDKYIEEDKEINLFCSTFGFCNNIKNINEDDSSNYDIYEITMINSSKINFVKANNKNKWPKELSINEQVSYTSKDCNKEKIEIKFSFESLKDGNKKVYYGFEGVETTNYEGINYFDNFMISNFPVNKDSVYKGQKSFELEHDYTATVTRTSKVDDFKFKISFKNLSEDDIKVNIISDICS